MIRSALAHNNSIKQMIYNNKSNSLFTISQNCVKQWDPNLLAYPTNMFLMSDNIYDSLIEENNFIYASKNSLNIYDIEKQIQV